MCVPIIERASRLWIIRQRILSGKVFCGGVRRRGTGIEFGWKGRISWRSLPIDWMVDEGWFSSWFILFFRHNFILFTQFFLLYIAFKWLFRQFTVNFERNFYNNRIGKLLFNFHKKCCSNWVKFKRHRRLFKTLKSLSSILMIRLSDHTLRIKEIESH